MSEQQRLTDAERRRALSYFDPAWYGARYEYDGLDTSALEDAFLSKGIWEGHDPGPYFSSTVYEACGRGGGAPADTPAFVHYVRTGCLERRWPNPVFNPHVYAYFLGGDAQNIADLFQHFLSEVRRGHTPTFSTIIPANWTEELTDILAATAYSQLFDPETSLMGLFPKCIFRPIFYKRIAHTREWGNELYDYLLSGWRKGYDPHPLFDGGHYLEMLEKYETLDHYSFDLQTPLEHFVENWSVGPNPSPFFDCGFFNNEANLQETAYRNPLEAFCALDPRYRFIAPHAKLNFGALGHAMQDSVAGDGRPFEARNLISLISSLRLETLERVPSADAAPVDAPLLSVLVLNYNNLEHTILSVFAAVRNSDDIACEFLVLDNGSGNWDVHQLERYIGRLPNVRIISSDRNTYFGEGNNLLIDAARGKYLLFLNNDAYLGKGSASTMLKVLERTPDCGMVGATLLFPDGTIQEEGGTVPDCGNSVQRSKHLPFDEFITRRAPDMDATTVDYVSAAVAMVPAALIEEIGGFDHIFEPFFFEDTDLCRRIRAHGKSVLVSHDAFVVHIENTSTGEFLADGFIKQINTNRLRYADRWLRRPAGMEVPRTGSRLSRFAAPKTDGKTKPTAIVYTPFPLSVGGGERYVLSVACALSATHSVTFATSCPTSRTRLAFVMDDLGLKGDFTLSSLDDIDLRAGADLFISMGNELAPSVKAQGKRNIFHCQFPFPLHRVAGRNIAFLDGYDEIVVNSQFTRDCTVKQLQMYGRGHMPVRVIHPPVPLNSDAAVAAYHTDGFGVATVGRYITEEHMKRQDIVLRALQQLKGHGIKHRSVIAGSLSTKTEDNAFFDSLKAAAPRHISVEANVSRARIADLLSHATIYMHATGFGINPVIQPQYMEHFGITIVEAMSYGCVPLVFDGGGAAEIVRDSKVGYTFTTVEDAVRTLVQHHGMQEEARQEMALRAFEAAKRYGEDIFVSAWQELART
ncbi:glycosyltransferase [Kordiimonas aestuarii]|uniref:glycosyltransferase n=1 Tax=Kordiimonas aestuarii TaxID=1005925 RepID=UPI0021CE1694|nr:glycosyltransferase [Kordiimonas aestuarii]